VSTWAHNKAMAPDARNEHIEISAGCRPTACLRVEVAALSSFVSMSVVVACQVS